MNLRGFDGCGFSASLAAINASGTAGFFFDQAPGSFADYHNFQPTAFARIDLQVAKVPEPASLALVIVALLGAGGGKKRGLKARPQEKLIDPVHDGTAYPVAKDTSYRLVRSHRFGSGRRDKANRLS